MSDLHAAIEIAAKAHRGQTRKNGSPYVLHPLRVMMRQSSEEAMIVAVLHDVVEDTDVSMEDLKTAGFAPAVIEALKLLTHAEEVPYEEYVDAIASNALARAVKLADLEDNMNLSEIPEVTEKDLARAAKYHRAWQRLQHPPSGV
jgi:(p)ppGpp synthase/HD superfamily hydrolase